MRPLMFDIKFSIFISYFRNAQPRFQFIVMNRRNAGEWYVFLDFFTYTYSIRTHLVYTLSDAT